jgi:hypothetical protein
MDPKAFVKSIKPSDSRSPFDAVVALADGGRRLFMLSDRIFPKANSICP